MFAIQQYCSFISDFWSIRFKSFTEPHPKMLREFSAHKIDCFSFVELTTAEGFLGLKSLLIMKGQKCYRGARKMNLFTSLVEL